MAVSPMAIIQTGFGLGQATAGYLKSREAEFKKADVRQQMEDTRYADYNQAYYEELNRRAQVGLPEEQRQYMEQQAERAAGGAAGGNGGNKGWSKGGGKAGGGGGWRSQGGKSTGKGLHAAWIDDPYCPPVSPTGQSSWWGGGALACLTESTPAPMTVPTRSVSWADEKFVHANSFACLEEAVEELNQAYDRLEIMYEDDIKSWDELQKT